MQTITSPNELVGARKVRGLMGWLAPVPTVIWIVLAELIFFAIFAEGFVRPENLLSIAVQTAPLAILAIGAAVVLISDGLDLSSGLLFTLVMSITTVLLRAGVSWPFALLGGTAVGLIGGLINGLLITVTNIPPFLATLGTLGIFWGLSLGITELDSIAVEPGPIYFLGEGAILGVPMPIISLLLVLIVSHVIVYKTPFGYYLYAIGSNEEAAKLSGVNVFRWKNVIYIYAGLLAAACGIVLLGRMHASHPNVGFGWEFEAIAAAVIGGVSIGGGRGKLYPVIFGTLFLIILRNGMNFMGVEFYWQTFVKGLIIVGAIVIDLMLKERRAASQIKRINP